MLHLVMELPDSSPGTILADATDVTVQSELVRTRSSHSSAGASTEATTRDGA
ncbi:MAG TPA: hypothetical protein VE155_17120 [Pseudonocardiaceae bacterium]|nr:hypothetical protein [Pseudonocardiaceae bacterium]